MESVASNTTATCAEASNILNVTSAYAREEDEYEESTSTVDNTTESSSNLDDSIVTTEKDEQEKLSMDVDDKNEGCTEKEAESEANKDILIPNKDLSEDSSFKEKELQIDEEVNKVNDLTTDDALDQGEKPSEEGQTNLEKDVEMEDLSCSSKEGQTKTVSESEVTNESKTSENQIEATNKSKTANAMEVDSNVTLVDCEKTFEDDPKDTQESVDLGEDPIAYDSNDAEVTTEKDIFSKEDNNECIIPDEENSTKDENVTNNSSGSESCVVAASTSEELNICMICKEIKLSKYNVTQKIAITYLCSDMCLDTLKETYSGEVITSDLRKDFASEKEVQSIDSIVDTIEQEPSTNFKRRCAECHSNVTDSEDVLAWETMDFCTKSCLAKYQKRIGSVCASCKKAVLSNLLGKYCVRFGCILRQFCSSICLESYKKLLKVCAYCQEDMSITKKDSVNRVIKGQRRDFCCMECCKKYCSLNERIPKRDGLCAVCHEMKKIEVEYEHENKTNKFCSDPCFVAFKFVNNITTGVCNMCNKHYNKIILSQYAMIYDNTTCYFCSKTCQNIYTIAHRRIIPCSWCKVKKYNFDMIQKRSNTGELLTLCCLNCLSLLQVSDNAVNSREVSCDNCHASTKSLYHLTMSDASIRNFCSYKCVMLFQTQFAKAPIVLAEPLVLNSDHQQKTKTYSNKKKKGELQMPIITSVVSLAPEAATENYTQTENVVSTNEKNLMQKKILILKNAPLPPQRNMCTMAKPVVKEQASEKKPEYADQECQTDIPTDKPNLIAIPVPIYIPSPIVSFKAPFAVPKPFPLPVQIPVFIPVTKNTSSNVLKELKKVQVKGPSDPFEAELLMMAELVADNNKKEEPAVENEEVTPAEEPADYSPEPMDSNTSFGDDMLQMALNMATDFEEPAVDLEGALTANTITAPQGQGQGNEENTSESVVMPQITERSMRGRRKNTRQTKTTPGRRGRRPYNHQAEVQEAPQNNPPPPPQEHYEKPDANMCLKYTFGVNAWKQWVTTKNAELEKCSRRPKLFKTEILQLTSDELNYSLCLFVKEVRKPNGAEYAPDTIYYLCLGIQQYLYENGRIDNIFCDPYYEKFTDCLDEVCKKFSVLYNESHYIVTRVEEEHLWESKQLGAHSPHVLLSTLMFFNTKHFNLTNVDEHMQLSFSHIMKHWKRNPSQPGGTGKTSACRNVLLRFYPPQSTLEGNSKKRRVYEQQENEENPLRCPVKLYEFYLSKCPESVKTRSDVFYLLPERSCVPDSPVWYSTTALGKLALEKMLHRVKMVKEVNVAVLTS